MYEDPDFQTAETFSFSRYDIRVEITAPKKQNKHKRFCSKIQFYKRKFQVLFATKFIFPHQFYKLCTKYIFVIFSI